MGSALLNTAADLEFAGTEDDFVVTLPTADSHVTPLVPTATRPETADALRMQVAERLAAHRSRRSGARTQTAEPARPVQGGRSAQIAAAVAERYARTPSYREVLAAEADRAIQQAHAAAEVAALNARAIAAAQQRLLDAYDDHASREQARLSEVTESPAVASEIASPDRVAASSAVLQAEVPVAQQLWSDLDVSEGRTAQAGSARPEKTDRQPGIRKTNQAAESAAPAKTAAGSAGGLTVRLYEDAEHFNAVSTAAAFSPARGRGPREELSHAEAVALDEEIAFRHAPVFEEPAGPTVALPANLIEFPRQLVAARKARPRYAEGPLREEMQPSTSDGQLRIFEVDPAEISTQPNDAEAHPAQWTSIWLDTPTQSQAALMSDAAPAGELHDEMEDPLARAVPAALQPASLARRAAAGAINFGIVLCGALGFAAAFAEVAGRGISGLPAAASTRQIGAALFAQLQLRGAGLAAVVCIAFLMLVYHALFFWFSTATPGMRSVRIALCTFEDENPARRNVRRRMLATLLSACPLGLGFAWAALDEQRLTWHDRMSRMYLRQY
jgi:hypothetical protein